MQLLENMVVADRYRLARMIGRGGMGSVWQAQHLGLDVPCAIKFIEGELANVAEAHARFEREARAAAALRSPHVVQIMDHGVWQGVPYIAMELLDGQDLGKFIASAPDGRLTPGELNPIVQQVCRALQKAHGAGVVHRDLKPDNIFLVNDDDGRKITKILDFGVAKSTSQAIDGSNTKTGAMLGTPYYMSPEQAQGIKSVDSRSDLWSLAVIVFQCVTGRLPFESEALGDLLVKIIVSPIPTPSELHRGVPPGFDTWWRKAADRNPDGRFPTAKEFAQSLEMALGQSSVTEVNFDRSKLQKLGGATAMMPSTSKSNPPAGAQTAGMPMPHMSTPNPVGQSGGYAPMMHTPPGAIHPGMGTPPAGMNPHMGTANPVVAETGIDLPKKGPPVVLIAAGMGVLVVVGLVFGGLAMLSGKKATGSGEDPNASASIAMSASAPATEAKNAPPPPQASDTVGTASAKPPEPDPATSASAANSVAAKPANNPPPQGGGGGAVAVKPPPGPAVKAPPQGGNAPPPPTKPPPAKPAGTNPLGF